MNFIFRAVIVLLFFLFAELRVAQAQQLDKNIYQLHQCLLENTSGRDREDLAKWSILVLASHPKLRELLKDPDQTIDQSSRKAAILIRGLFAEKCAAEVQNTIVARGQPGMMMAVGLLAQIATQELISNPLVAENMLRMGRMIDPKNAKNPIENK